MSTKINSQQKQDREEFEEKFGSIESFADEAILEANPNLEEDIWDWIQAHDRKRIEEIKKEATKSIIDRIIVHTFYVPKERQGNLKAFQLSRKDLEFLGGEILKKQKD